ncbi:hypothetical protein TRVL_08793 [Trypanosoma vivax]|uniref:RanBP2-type domain-containing protein n=1 Tax=Trypanosoma vivax (strain Y486) TaxID=1055687 RepID=G0TS71_TRYVY|nr:hypothetical protein TRVL_08793 [Trypanosoma vivax]CCC46796.1 conserved hypothetical protein [Trypanosoma vivax Y486]
MFNGLHRSLAMAGLAMLGSRRDHHTTAPLFLARVAGDWACPCGFSNFASRTVCFQCHRVKPLYLRAAGEEVQMESEILGYKKGDWVCTCGTHNFAKRDCCLSCGAGRPSAHGLELRKGRMLAGDWICPGCKTHNFRSRKECMLCGIQSTASATIIPDKSNGARNAREANTTPWTCLMCHAANAQGSHSCEVCGGPCPKQATSPPSPPRRSDDWDCASCGFHNYSCRTKCKNCKAPLGVIESAEDDAIWICECGYKNFKDRSICRDCGIAKVTTT